MSLNVKIHTEGLRRQLRAQSVAAKNVRNTIVRPVQRDIRAYRDESRLHSEAFASHKAYMMDGHHDGVLERISNALSMVDVRNSRHITAIDTHLPEAFYSSVAIRGELESIRLCVRAAENARPMFGTRWAFSAAERNFHETIAQLNIRRNKQNRKLEDINAYLRATHEIYDEVERHLNLAVQGMAALKLAVRCPQTMTVTLPERERMENLVAAARVFGISVNDMLRLSCQERAEQILGILMSPTRGLTEHEVEILSLEFAHSMSNLPGVSLGESVELPPFYIPMPAGLVKVEFSTKVAVSGPSAPWSVDTSMTDGFKDFAVSVHNNGVVTSFGTNGMWMGGSIAGMDIDVGFGDRITAGLLPQMRISNSIDVGESGKIENEMLLTLYPAIKVPPPRAVPAPAFELQLAPIPIPLGDGERSPAPQFGIDWSPIVLPSPRFELGPALQTAAGIIIVVTAVTVVVVACIFVKPLIPVVIGVGSKYGAEIIHGIGHLIPTAPQLLPG